jgi:hypothetical protein
MNLVSCLAMTIAGDISAAAVGMICGAIAVDYKSVATFVLTS